MTQDMAVSLLLGATPFTLAINAYINALLKVFKLKKLKERWLADES